MNPAKWLNIFLILVFSYMMMGSLHARNIEVTPYAGWYFAGKLSVQEGDANIRNNMNFGLSISVPIRPDIMVELIYNRLDTYVDLIRRPTGVTEKLFDMSEETFHIGPVYHLQKKNNLVLYSTVSLGATYFNPKSVSNQSEWRFSVAAGGGMKAYLSERVGIRLQARLILPIFWSGGSLWCGTGGCSVGLGAGSSLPQVDLTGGLIFRL